MSARSGPADRRRTLRASGPHDRATIRLDHATELAAAIAAADGLTLVLTGAGISLASGIPTFRGSDPGAIWARDVTEMATLRYYTVD